jgi:hypothetical protein
VRYHQDLQVQLRERYRRLMTSNHRNGQDELVLVTGWINQQSALRAIITEAEKVSPEIDIEDFKQTMQTQGETRWSSDSEEERAVFGWKVMTDLAGGKAQNIDQTTMWLINYREGGDYLDNWRTFVERVMQPFFDYVGERISTGNSVLHVLERYVRNTEWFTRDDLHAKYLTDTKNGEEVYNLNLQHYLFQDGNYITYAKARSAAGEPDLIGDLDTDDPLICDGKIFANGGRGPAYLAKGFHQVIHYAQDYNKNVAFLVIFNLTDRLLRMPTDGPSDSWPPYVEESSVRVYFIVIRALPPAATASKLGKARPAIVTREGLFDVDASEADFDAEAMADQE